MIGRVASGRTWLVDEPRRHANSRGTLRRQGSRADEAPQRGGSVESRGSVVSTRPVRILIVDDDIQSSSSLEVMLRAAGYSETRVAYSGHAALAIAADFPPSVALLELRLLDMSGYEVARLLRRQSQDLRLIALSVSRDHGGRESALFEHCLLKPVTRHELLESMT
jgi:CheY-like chemotaxis protein